MIAILWPYLAFILLAFSAFFNSLGHPFVHDEIVLILQNQDIAKLGDLFGIFFPSAGSHPDSNVYYRPTLEFIYRLEYFLFGFVPHWWHVFNVLLHGINGALAFRVLRLTGFNINIALAVAILFVIHPIQTESVACVAGISNLLMAFFVFLSLIAYLRNKTILSLVWLILALLTKEQAVMLIPLYVLVDRYRGKWQPMRMSMAVLAVILIFIWRQALTGSHVLSDIIASPGELKLRLLSIAQVILTNVRMLLLPHDLHYYRSTDILSIHWPWWVGLIVVIWGIIRLRSKEILFGVLFFFVALLPVLNIVPLVIEYSRINTMEHFLYVPMIGMMLAIVFLVTRFCKRHAEQVLIIIMICFFYVTLISNEYWQNEIVLFERMVQYEPSFGRGHYLLAGAYYHNNDYALANEHFSKAYAIMDGYSRKAIGAKPKRFFDNFKRDILFDWAHSYEEMGMLKSAESKYKQALEVDAKDAKIWDNLGWLYVRMGKSAEAVVCFEQALQVDPSFRLASEHLRMFKQ